MTSSSWLLVGDFSFCTAIGISRHGAGDRMCLYSRMERNLKEMVTMVTCSFVEAASLYFFSNRQNIDIGLCLDCILWNMVDVLWSIVQPTTEHMSTPVIPSLTC